MQVTAKVALAIACVAALLATAGAAEVHSPFIEDEARIQALTEEATPPAPKPLPAEPPLAPGQIAHKPPAPAKPQNPPQPPQPKPESPAAHAKPLAAELKGTPSGPSQSVVRSTAVNVTSTPTTKQTAEIAETRAKKAAPSLLDVKVKDTTVTISPTGVIRVRKPDVDIDALKVAQMIAQFVKTIQKVIEAGKTQSSAPIAKKPKEPAVAGQNAKPAKARGNDDDDGNGEDDDDSDGAREVAADVVDDTKPFARKLPFRVRREAIRGSSSVGNIAFEGRAPVPF